MAERNVGAGDLGGTGTVAAGSVAPGAVTAQQLSPGGIGFAALGSLSDGVPLTDPNAGVIDVRKIQQRLREFGYPIVVDGIWGPKSKAAWTDFTNRGGSMTTEPREAAGGTPVPAGGGGAAATSPVAAGMGSPAAPPTDTTIEEDYPALAAFLAIPEVGALLRQAKAEGWPPEKLQARVQATEWWKTTSPTKRAFMGLEATDPMAAKAKIAEMKETVRKIKDAYLIELSDDAMNMYARQIAEGGSDVTRFQGEMREIAKGKFPSLAASLDQGMSVRQLADPYVQQAARTLEVSADAIDLNDPKWYRVLQGYDDGGKPRPMTGYEWDRVLKTDATYGFDRTTQARDQAARIGENIARQFGRIG